MRSLTQITLLSVAFFVAVSCSVEAKLPGQCDPAKPETCQGGQQATFHAKPGSLGDAEEFDWEDERPEGMDGPDQIDVSDMSTHPIAENPDLDFSGAPVEIDLSQMEGNLTDEERRIPTTTDEANPANKAGENAKEDPNGSLDNEEADMAAFGEVFLRLETVTNEYLCTTSGIALYNMDSDTEIWAMVSKVLANQLQNMKQNYGAQIIEQWSNNRRANNYTCIGIKPFDEVIFNHPANILMEAKELISRWLEKKEVDPAELTDHFIPQFRSMLSRWFVMRLMTFAKQDESAATPNQDSAEQEQEGAVVTTQQEEEDAGPSKLMPEAVGEALLPLVMDEESPGDTCFSGGGLHSIFIRTRPADYSSDLTAAIHKMLDICFTTGQSADKPMEYANTLMGADREAQARELHKLAVERGELCHELQRPEQLHRKDLTARPIWPAKAVPELQKVVALAKKMREANVYSKLPFGVKSSNHTAKLDLTTGKADIVQLYGGEQDALMNEDTCALLGDELCDEFKEVANEFLDSNDAYLFTCNETFTMGFWQITGAAKSSSETGTANIVLQAFVPLETNEKSMILRAGKEVVLVDTDEVILMDDTFENYFEVLSEEGGSGDDEKPIQLIHIQVCHPDLHDKALQVPGHKCAPAPSN